MKTQDIRDLIEIALIDSTDIDTTYAAQAKHVLSVLREAGVIPEPVTISRYFNLYDSKGASTIFRYDTREEADRQKSHNRIAVLRIDITDGVITSHIEPG